MRRTLVRALMIILEIANVNASIVFLDLLAIDGERGMIPESLLELAKEKLSLYRLIEIPQFPRRRDSVS